MNRNLSRIVRKSHTLAGCLAVSRKGLLYPANKIVFDQKTITNQQAKTIFFSKCLFIYCFFWIEIIQPFLNLEGASKCISLHSINKIIITPNFIKKYSWIGENKLVI